MKLLLDENISWKLITRIEHLFPESKHVTEIAELSQPSRDVEIWNYAIENDFMVLTKDEDFYKFVLYKNNSPKVILIKLGNLKTNELESILKVRFEEITKFAGNKEYKILEIR